MRFDEGGKPVGPALPEGALLDEPALGGGEPVGIEMTGADAAALFGPDEPRCFEHREMFQEGGQAHFEWRRQLFYRRRAIDEAIDDRAPRRIGERMEDGVEFGQLVYHMENYSKHFAKWKTICSGQEKRAASKGDP